jgi:hypothetical protein
MPGTRRRRRRRQFLSRGLDQDCWEPWSVSNRLNNTKSDLPFLRPLGTVESCLLEWQTCLVCSPPECSGVGDFDKAKPLDSHDLCWKWCWNVTDFRKGCQDVRSLTRCKSRILDGERRAEGALTGDFALCHCAPVAGRSSLTNLITGIWKLLQ